MISGIVRGIIDRPGGSRHPKRKDLRYSIHCGYPAGTLASDGEERAAYLNRGR